MRGRYTNDRVDGMDGMMAVGLGPTTGGKSEQVPVCLPVLSYTCSLSPEARGWVEEVGRFAGDPEPVRKKYGRNVEKGVQSNKVEDRLCGVSVRLCRSECLWWGEKNVSDIRGRTIDHRPDRVVRVQFAKWVALSDRSDSVVIGRRDLHVSLFPGSSSPPIKGFSGMPKRLVRTRGTKRARQVFGICTKRNVSLEC